MRLIILSYDYSPNNGGIARLCKEIVKQCIATNTDYLVVTPVQGPKEDNVVRISGRRIYLEYKILRYLRKIKQKDDAILTGTFHPDGLLAWLSGIPCFFLAHGAELLPSISFIRKLFWNPYRKWALKNARMVFANSNYTAALVTKCSPHSCVKAIPLAVDSEYFHPTKPKISNGYLNLCSLSRLEKFKAHDFVIKTIAALPTKYRLQIHLDIGGKGPYKESLEFLVNRLGLEENIHFIGFISDEKLRDFYSEHDLFILCTREDRSTNHVEGFGLVFTEAQACGTPCIGADSGGIPDAVIRGKGGWLIEPDNQRQLSKLLIEIVENRNLLKTQRNLALERVKNDCNWEKYYLELYNTIKNNCK